MTSSGGGGERGWLLPNELKADDAPARGARRAPGKRPGFPLVILVSFFAVPDAWSLGVCIGEVICIWIVI